jgi:hypothetical protein
LRPWYPLKFDFCRMTLQELVSTIDHALCEDARQPDTYKPIVAIGHTKDLDDFDTVAGFLDYLRKSQSRSALFIQPTQGWKRSFAASLAKPQKRQPVPGSAGVSPARLMANLHLQPENKGRRRRDASAPSFRARHLE